MSLGTIASYTSSEITSYASSGTGGRSVDEQRSVISYLRVEAENLYSCPQTTDLQRAYVL